MIKCKNCGKLFNEDEIFCSNCRDPNPFYKSNLEVNTTNHNPEDHKTVKRSSSSYVCEDKKNNMIFMENADAILWKMRKKV